MERLHESQGRAQSIWSDPLRGSPSDPRKTENDRTSNLQELVGPIEDEVMEEALKAGATISYRSSGNSLKPLIWSGQVCTLIPVRFAETVNEGDIVFCKVQESGEYYTLKVLSKRWDGRRHEDYWMLGNASGNARGLCYLQDIFGKVVDIN